jgi:polyisoprenoid-binding protein YceI
MNSVVLRTTLGGAALWLALASAAQAAVYTKVQPTSSHLAFGYTQMNVKMQGAFNKLTINAFSFDPAQPDAAKVDIDVPLISVDSGSEEANAELLKDEWFATKASPVAHFASRSVKALGDNRYQVDGELTIKGTTRPVSMPVTFKENGTTGVFDGTFTINRSDFKIGEGSWGDFSIVANEVTVTFHIVAGQ